MNSRNRWISYTLLIVGLVFHEALVVATYGGQVPLLSSSRSSSLAASSAASIFDPVAAASSVVRVSQSFPPDVEILDSGAEPQQPTGQILRNHHQQQPTKTETSHDGVPLSRSDLVGGSSISSELSVAQEEMAVKKRAFIAALSSLLSYITLNELYYHSSLAGQEEARWVASSDSWLDRKTCQWFSICGASHLHSHVHIGGHTQRKAQGPLRQDESWRSAWTKGKSRPEDWSDDERVLRDIPAYVFEYAPLVHLYSGEHFWPGDIAEHLTHTTPHLNYTPAQARSEHPNLTNLNDLNQWNRGKFLYLTSDDNVEDRPDWLGGKDNIPKTPPDSGVDDEDDASWTEWNEPADDNPPEDIDGADADWSEAGQGSFQEQGGERPDPIEIQPRAITSQLTKPAKGGRSDAPAVLVVVNKGHGVVDAFWFYFYSYNLGNVVLNVRFGNHVGDWEHSMVRFHRGQPKAVFLSEHSFGEAYTYEAVEKIGGRVSLDWCLFSSFIRLLIPPLSRSYTPLPAHTPCTPPPAGTLTCCHWVYCTMRQTVVHCGIHF